MISPIVDFLQGLPTGHTISAPEYTQIVAALVDSIRKENKPTAVQIYQLMADKKLGLPKAAESWLIYGLTRISPDKLELYDDFANVYCYFILTDDIDTISKRWKTFQTDNEPEAKRQRLEKDSPLYRNWQRKDRPFITLPDVTKTLDERDAQRYLQFDASFLSYSTANGLGDNSVIYLRDMFLKQLNFLQSTSQSVVIRGPPGCGKSTCTYLYALSEMLRESRVFWISVSGACVLEENYLYSSEDYAIEDAYDVFRNAPQDGKNEIWIIDGYSVPSTPNITLTKLIMKILKKHQRLVINTSMAARLKNHLSLPEFLVPSWTFKEYETAYENFKLKTKVGRFVEASLEQKFYYAGGSCRYMFAKTISEVTAELSMGIQMTEEIDSLQDMRQTTANRILGRVIVGDANNYDGNAEDTSVRFVSEYVKKKIAAMKNTGELVRLYHVFSSNPCMQGYIFEMWCARKISGEGGIEYQYHEGDKKLSKWESSKVQWYTPEKPAKYTEKVWLLPDRFNEKTYDMICYDPEKGNIRFVQATISPSHNIDVDYVKDVVQRFLNNDGSSNEPAITRSDKKLGKPQGKPKNEIKSVEFFILVPMSVLKVFKFGNIISMNALKSISPSYPILNSETIKIVGVEFP